MQPPREGRRVGEGGNGQIIQVGKNNTTGFVDVPAGATLTYTQVGNNLSPPTQAGVQIISTTNTGNISITQTGF